MSSDEQVVFRSYPSVFWLFGLGMIVIGNVVGESALDRALLSLVGAVALAFPSALTVTVDARQGVVNLRYLSLVRRSIKTNALAEICAVNVSEDWEGERMYRMELVLCSGQIIPLQNGYSVGKAGKERRAQRLRSALGLGTEVRLLGR